MASKRPKKSTIQPLEDCIKRLEGLPSFPALDPKEAGELYVSTVAFLHHLSIDQEAVSRIRKRHRENNANDNASPAFPKSNEIPAMSAVVHNQSFFQALVSCLKSTTYSPDSVVATTSLSSSAAHNTLYAPGARKRSQSIDLSSAMTDASTNKSAKLAPGQSPHAGKRPVNPSSGNQSMQQQPQMNIRIIAAAILYIAFEPFDHWPVPLIEAYAEDSFGARSWVDDPACHQLVQNLELVHVGNGNMADSGSIIDDDVEAEALMVAEFYQMRNEERSPTTTRTAREEARRRGSLSSTASGDAMPLAPSLMRNRSASFGSESGTLQKSRSSTSPKSKQQGKKIKTNGEGSSEYGDDAEVATATSMGKRSNDSDGASSSSGEDEEIFVEELSVDGSEVFAGDVSPKVSTTSDPPPPRLEMTYPVRPKSLKFVQVRRRFFGLNLDYAHQAVSEKLGERLDIKSKQNSGLLQCLPSFTTIPNVRSLVTANLEKWLQSPALSGLARNLFSVTVRHMQNVDPPLPADLDAVDNILSMKLKANQLNCHIENLTAVATTIPTSAVANHIYSHLLREILLSMDPADAQFTDHVSMVHAVHEVLPRELQAVGIASSLLGILTKPPETMENLAKPKLVRRICSLIRALNKKFVKSFDPCEVMAEMLNWKVDANHTWTRDDEENKARLMFQCATLVVDPSAVMERRNPTGTNAKKLMSFGEEVSVVQNRLQKSRKIMLRWCCNDYASICASLVPQVNGHKKMTSHSHGTGNEIIGAGPANYSSLLDGLDKETTPHWLNVIRCVLFMETSESSNMQRFLVPGFVSVEDDPDWADEAKRIDLCCDLGADVDDDTVWLVLNSATNKGIQMPHETALLVLEHLFHCCRKERHPQLLIQDPNLLWKLYEIVEYVPPEKTDGKDPSNDKNSEDGVKTHPRDDPPARQIPRLAYSGMWWRVTGLALVMCGAAPKSVGTVAWEQHPTLAALIKMVTSDRYRFPTVDCDDLAREEQKRTEQSMRDEEAKITEQLFLPPKKPKKIQKHVILTEITHQGPRASRRQQEKREKILEKQKEKEIAEERVEASRRKKLLRAAQKSITLLDPKRGPRKPPRESADLIFSVGELFDLPTVFQKNLQPDFVLATIGSTSRSAIERAYDWLIPIISYLPDTISRLPASASCFLLLRAYGTQGEERSELQTLSAPLLQHVHDSLIGRFGEEDAVRAFELLFADLASHNSDRRRCARRVLQNAIGKEKMFKSDYMFEGSNHAWVSSLTQVQYAESILVDAVNNLSTAATFERGSNLRYLVLALHTLTHFARNKGLTGDWDFAALLMDLILRRPAVFASALSSFTNLCSLAVNTIFEEYTKIVTVKEHPLNGDIGSVKVEMVLCHNPFEATEKQLTKVLVPLSLLKSSCVLLSIWFSEESNEKDVASIEGLVNMLLKPLDSANGTGDNSVVDMDGLASAKMVDTEDGIVPVEFWVMLAKSRSDFIAKRAALSAPTSFLPRLLLCSGLPRASFLTMVDRLGKLGENSADTEKEYNQLLIPSASSEWDIGRLGNRREVHRRLHGRISAYFRMYNLAATGVKEPISLTFYKWLSESFEEGGDKLTKLKTKKSKPRFAPLFESLHSASSLLSRLPQDHLGRADSPTLVELDGDASDMTIFLGFEDTDLTNYPENLEDAGAIESFLKQVFDDNNPRALDAWLSMYFGGPESFEGGRKRRRRMLPPTKPKLARDELAVLLLQCYIGLERKVEGLASTIVSWVPRLSKSAGSPKLWKLLFAEGQKPSFMWENLFSRCLEAWDHNQVISCRMWLLSGGSSENLDLLKVVKFLIGGSTFRGVHAESFVDIPVASEDSAWARSEETVQAAARLSLDSLVSLDCEQRLRSRNDIPESLLLLLLIARLGRKQVHFISEAILNRLPDQTESVRRRALLSLLRLYACFPFSLNLSAAALRSNLTKAVEICADDWLSWRCPLDDTLQDVLRCAFAHGSGELPAQMLVDTAKKHPLLLLRKLDRITTALENDALASENAIPEKEGIISGQTLGGPLEARVNGKVMMIRVKHWGYNYTESSWFLILDAISAIPHEVLFGCAVKMGLTSLLDIYLQLIHIQSQLHSSDRLSMLKERFAALIGQFMSSKSHYWDVWLASTMPEFPSLGATRNTLTSCGLISHEEAMASVRRAAA